MYNILAKEGLVCRIGTQAILATLASWDCCVNLRPPGCPSVSTGIARPMGVIDNMDNTQKPVNTGFSAVTLNYEPNIGV